MLNYAIVGFGGLGKVHFGLYEELKKIHNDVKLVSICDVDETKFTQSQKTNLGSNDTDLDLSDYNLYTDLEEMINKEKLDFIISAVPTYLHDKIAIPAMKKGINVFSEKPMSINYERAEEMLRVSKECNVKLMIGQCLRFWPAYMELKKMIDEKKYGRVVKAEFQRISQTPIWAWENWYLDYDKSGGATLDLHVHDLDFINYAFGKPLSVTSYATNEAVTEESVMTVYKYKDKLVVATGEWGHAQKYAFQSMYRVRFEKATLELSQGKLMLYTDDEAKEIELSQDNAYLYEVVEFVNCIKENRESKINPPESTLQTIEIGMAESKSICMHKEIEL